MITRLINKIRRFASEENRSAFFNGELVIAIAPEPGCRCSTDPDANRDLAAWDTLKGDLSEPRPHPHPLFADKIQVREQNFMRVQVCQTCGSVSVARGVNFVETDSRLKKSDSRLKKSDA
jgi:hypothetical protein